LDATKSKATVAVARTTRLLQINRHRKEKGSSVLPDGNRTTGAVPFYDFLTNRPSLVDILGNKVLVKPPP